MTKNQRNIVGYDSYEADKNLWIHLTINFSFGKSL